MIKIKTILWSVLVVLMINVAIVKGEGFQGTATKFGSANPSISIVGYSGPEEIKKRIELVLRRCDWFKVLPAEQGTAASVTMQVKAATTESGTYISALVKDSSLGGSYSIDVNDTKDYMAVLKFVDKLLYQRFKVPALCARKIVFVVRSLNGKKELFSCYLDGSEYGRLTHNNAICTEPSWGNANALVYTMLKYNAIQVVYVDYKNNRQRIVSSFEGLNSSPALSHDGRLLSLPLSFDKKVDLYVIDLVNGSKKRLTNDKSVESSPCWSPDGSKICYVSDASGRPQLYLVSSQGGKSVRMQLGGNECVSPDWSDVSNRLCFCTRSNSGQYIIKVLDMSTPNGNPETVTLASGDWEAPSWAPDGRHIICTRSAGGRRDLYLVDSEMMTFSQITKDTQISLPAWQPAK